MRKVIAYELLSLDGVAEDPDTFITDFDEAMDAHLGQVIATQDSVLLGRRTYDQWSGFWPASDIQPFAGFINAVEKFVVTSTPLESPWANTQVVPGRLAEFVTKLKRQSGQDIGLHGSIALTQSLLAQGLVDELRLVVAPALQIEGRKLFDRASTTRLTLTRNDNSPSGYLLLDFRVGDSRAV